MARLFIVISQPEKCPCLGYPVAVAGGLTRIISWIDDARAEHAKFKAEELKTMMEELKEPLVGPRVHPSLLLQVTPNLFQFYHLDEEVAHLAPDNLKAFTPAELAQHNKDLMTYIRANGDGHLVVPFLRSHTPPGKNRQPRF